MTAYTRAIISLAPSLFISAMATRPCVKVQLSNVNESDEVALPATHHQMTAFNVAVQFTDFDNAKSCESKRCHITNTAFDGNSQHSENQNCIQGRFHKETHLKKIDELVYPQRLDWKFSLSDDCVVQKCHDSQLIWIGHGRECEEGPFTFPVQRCLNLDNL